MYSSDTIIFTLLLIFGGAAMLSTLALFTRQSLLIAYIVLGALLGPWGLKLVNNTEAIQKMGDIGIIFLLFLLGLHLNPQSLFNKLRKTTWVTLVSSVVFGAVTYLVLKLFGYSVNDAVVVSAACMFSSTIIGLKLLPTTILEHQHAGEIVTSILLMQDIIAIVVLLFLESRGSDLGSWLRMASIFVTLPGLCVVAYLGEKFILTKLIQRFGRIHEYVFLLSLAWCLIFVNLAGLCGLSEGIGAFVAGVMIAANPVSQFIADNLKPLRDFFLVMFFFSIGATFNFHFLPKIYIPVILLSFVVLIGKPLIFRILLHQVSENRYMAWEIGWRLGQLSEFSLLVSYMALSLNLISQQASYLLQAVTMVTFLLSSYLVVLRYPTPVSVSDKLRRD